mmetsp:Transcript_620/g.2189  ORF Transcript_620/g.2189 Transcript_620/m.2189 type:complete len:230 (-) Transcript_620:693-1382(-)
MGHLGPARKLHPRLAIGERRAIGIGEEVHHGPHSLQETCATSVDHVCARDLPPVLHRLDVMRQSKFRNELPPCLPVVPVARRSSRPAVLGRELLLGEHVLQKGEHGAAILLQKPPSSQFLQLHCGNVGPVRVFLNAQLGGHLLHELPPALCGLPITLRPPIARWLSRVVADLLPSSADAPQGRKHAAVLPQEAATADLHDGLARNALPRSDTGVRRAGERKALLLRQML